MSLNYKLALSFNDTYLRFRQPVRPAHYLVNELVAQCNALQNRPQLGQRGLKLCPDCLLRLPIRNVKAARLALNPKVSEFVYPSLLARPDHDGRGGQLDDG